MLRGFALDPEKYRKMSPYPVTFQDDALDEEFARKLQEEILAIPLNEFDRYENPFEQKYTLRDKHKYPTLLQQLMNYVTSSEYLEYLSEYTGYRLINDDSRMYWGVHVYEPGDKLDIHVDAGCHPENALKKQVTWGLYLSNNWAPTYGCDFEVWEGDSVIVPGARLHRMVEKIAPMFNRMVLFTCLDNAWHGNPVPCQGPSGSKRIFVTLSYLSDSTKQNLNKNQYKKAFFIARPTDEPDAHKDHLRLLRSNPDFCKDVYRIKL